MVVAPGVPGWCVVNQGWAAGRRRAGALGEHGHGGGVDAHAGPHALQAIDDDLLAGLEAAGDHAVAVDQPAELDGAILDGAVGLDDQHELLVLVGADGAVGDDGGLIGGAADQLQPGEQPGGERWFGFGKTARARTVPLRGIQLVVEEVDVAFVREGPALAGGTEQDRRR